MNVANKSGMLGYGLILFLSTFLTWQILCDSLFNSRYFYLLFGLVYLSEIITYQATRSERVDRYFPWFIVGLLTLNVIVYLVFATLTAFYCVSVAACTSIRSFLVITRIQDISRDHRDPAAMKKKFDCYQLLANCSAITIPLLSVFYQTAAFNRYLITTYVIMVVIVVWFGVSFRPAPRATRTPVSWNQLPADYKRIIVIISFIHVLYPYIMKTIVSNAVEYNVYVLLRVLITTAVMYIGFTITRKNFIILQALTALSFAAVVAAGSSPRAAYVAALSCSVFLVLYDYFLEWRLASPGTAPADTVTSAVVNVSAISGDLGGIKTCQLGIGILLALSSYLALELLGLPLHGITMVVLMGLAGMLIKQCRHYPRPAGLFAECER